MINFDQIVYLCHLKAQEMVSSLDTTYNSTLQALLGRFPEIFATPSSLPPLHSVQHHIHLKDELVPINVCPYRYPYFQKNEIEKLVQEMLDLGVIKPSTSPFSLLVLFYASYLFVQAFSFFILKKFSWR